MIDPKVPYEFGPYEHPGTLVPRLLECVEPFETLLDVGGGGGTVGHPVWEQKGVKVSVLDIFPPETTPPNFTLGNVLDAIEIYGEKSFDVVIACEIIEHLEKEDSRKALEIIQKLARKAVLITMPNGFTNQSPENEDTVDEPWRNNPYQKHLCGWEYQELLELDWKVYMLGATAESTAACHVIAWRVF